MDCLELIEDVDMEYFVGCTTPEDMFRVTAQHESVFAEIVEQAGVLLLEAQSIEGMSKNMNEIDSVLSSLETNLVDSKVQLETLMKEIKTVHDEAESISVRLAKRTEIATQLDLAITSRLLRTDTVNVLLTEEVNSPNFVRHLQHLQVAMQSLQVDTSPLCQTLRPTFDALSQNCSLKIRTYLVPRILHLRRSRTNIAIHQQNVLCKSRSCVQFLATTAPMVLDEIKRIYVTVMSKVYATKFHHYIQTLSKLNNSSGSSILNLKLVEKAALKGGVDPIAHAAPYVVGEDRYRVIDRSLTHETIVPHIERNKGSKYFFEETFHSVLGVLCDVVTHEYLFFQDFFRVGSLELLQEVFLPVVTMVIQHLSRWIQSSEDHISVLCIVCMVHRTKALMERRRIDVIHGLLDSLLLHLWPRFKILFDNHVTSLRNVSSVDLLTISWESTTVHPMTARYAEFTAGLLRFLPLCDSLEATQKDESEIAPRLAMLESNIRFVSIEYDHVLLLLCSSLPTEQQRNVTLLNNYFHVYSVWSRRAIKEGTPFVETLLTQLSSLRTAVGQCLVDTVVPFLSTCIKKNEVDPNPTEIENCVKQLHTTWKTSLQSLQAHSQQLVVHPPNVVEVLKHSCMQLLLYNTRLNAIVGRCWRNPPFRAFIVTNQQMLQGMRTLSNSLISLTE